VKYLTFTLYTVVRKKCDSTFVIITLEISMDFNNFTYLETGMNASASKLLHFA